MRRRGALVLFGISIAVAELISPNGWVAATAGAQVVAVGLGSEPAATAEPAVLKVCADPDNLPFSKSDGAQRGLYVELAELVGKRLKLKIEYVWWLTYNQKRALRNTLLAGDCDAVFALPATPGYGGKRITLTKPFLHVSYAMVTPSETSITTLDELKSKRIAVQFSSTPQLFFASRGDFNVTTFRREDELFAALQAGDVDAAFLWGPAAGYANKTKYANAWHVTPFEGEDMGGGVAVGVRAGRDDLVARLNEALESLQPEILQLADKYGVPTGPTLAVDQKREANVATPEPADMPKSMPTDAANAEAGHVQFNNHCSHCHAQDAQSPLPERDLRRLKKRYVGDWKDVAEKTIIEGRPDSGMPIWGDALTAREIANIISYLETVQN